MEDIFVALNSILSHKMRSMLTMLGIIIGIGAIIAIFSIIEGNTENTKRQLIGGSNNTTRKAPSIPLFQKNPKLRSLPTFLSWERMSCPKSRKFLELKML